MSAIEIDREINYCDAVQKGPLSYPSIGTNDEGKRLVKPPVAAFTMKHGTSKQIQSRWIPLKIFNEVSLQ